jgi:glutathione S-transferase
MESGMGLIESANPEVKGLRGLHLYHFFLSNCSQRVRLALEESAWLSGERLGLADLSWSVNAHRLVQLEYDLSNRPQILDWYQRLAKRPSFERAVAGYRPG